MNLTHVIDFIGGYGLVLLCAYCVIYAALKWLWEPRPSKYIIRSLDIVRAIVRRERKS